MDIKSVNVVYFSPTQSTKKIIFSVATSIGLNAPSRQYSLTTVKERSKEFVFDSNDLVIVGIPSYGGRLPQVSPPLFSNLTGNNTPVIIVGVYGNRGYDDLLIEIKTVLEERGFYCVAAMAIVAQHCLAKKLGVGRPNEMDYKKIVEFGELVRKKIEDDDQVKIPPIIPGNFPYKDLPPSPPIAPVTTDKCIYCMLCFRWCPTDAIADYSPNDTDASKCIRCQGCVKRCPVQAREIVNEQYKEKIASLEGMFENVVCESEYFL